MHIENAFFYSRATCACREQDGGVCMVSPSVSNDAAKDKFPKGFEARPSACRGHTRLD